MEFQTIQKQNNYQNLTKSIPFTSSKLLSGIAKSALAPLESDTFELSTKLPKTINHRAIRDLNIRNLRILNEQMVSGGTFERRPLQDLYLLKQAGIETVIDFRTETSGTMAKKCKSTGLKYLNIPLDDVRERSNPRYFIRTKGKTTVVKPEFIKSLKEYFELMNTTNCYVGCHYGIDRTNMGLLLNYFFNSKYDSIPPKIIFWPGEGYKNVLNRNLKSIKKIFKSLTPEQKKELGLPEKYEDALKEKIQRLIKQNNMVDGYS